MQTVPAIDEQTRWWNHWITTYRETTIEQVSEDQARHVLQWIDEERDALRRPLDIIDVGCGGGWLCERLTPFGNVTGTDLADEVIDRARARRPDIRWLAGDTMSLDLGGPYDVVVTLEVLSCVADHTAFLKRCMSLLKPEGLFILATPNRWVVERFGVREQAKGQIRNWTTRNELRRLLLPHFEVQDMLTLTPRGNRGILRVVNSGKVNRLVAPFVGGRQNLTRLKERLGLGWTLMARGRLRPDHVHPGSSS